MGARIHPCPVCNGARAELEDKCKRCGWIPPKARGTVAEQYRHPEPPWSYVYAVAAFLPLVTLAWFLILLAPTVMAHDLESKQTVRFLVPSLIGLAAGTIVFGFLSFALYNSHAQRNQLFSDDQREQWLTSIRAFGPISILIYWNRFIVDRKSTKEPLFYDFEKPAKERLASYLPLRVPFLRKTFSRRTSN